MTATKENYRKYSLIALILVFGVLIVLKLWAFANALMGAFTIFVLVRRQMIFLTERWRVNRRVAATALVLEATAVIIIPVYFAVRVMLGKVQGVTIDIPALTATVQHFDELVRDRFGYTLLSAENISTATSYLSRTAQMLVNQVSSFVVTTVALIFLLWFMLVDYRVIESYVYDLMPFSDANRRRVSAEIYRLVRSNAIGIPLLAIVQGAVAYAGYLFFGVPNPFLMAVLTGIVSIVPLVGTGLVWVPVAAYMALTGNVASAIGLSAYSLIILINIDNLIRFIMQKQMADTHPLITVFGVILGLSLFGFWGVVFGPLLLSMFFLLINILKNDYLE